jgi:hypothetical protein
LQSKDLSRGSSPRLDNTDYKNRQNQTSKNRIYS